MFKEPTEEETLLEKIKAYEEAANWTACFIQHPYHTEYPDSLKAIEFYKKEAQKLRRKLLKLRKK